MGPSQLGFNMLPGCGAGEQHLLKCGTSVFCYPIYVWVCLTFFIINNKILKGRKGEAGRERKREEGKEGAPKPKPCLGLFEGGWGAAGNPCRAAVPPAAPPAGPSGVGSGAGELIQPGSWWECSVLSPDRPATPFPQGPPLGWGLRLRRTTMRRQTPGHGEEGPPHALPPRPTFPVLCRLEEILSTGWDAAEPGTATRQPQYLVPKSQGHSRGSKTSKGVYNLPVAPTRLTTWRTPRDDLQRTGR